MRTRGPIVVLALVLALCWAWPVVAQEQGGSIQGVVKDSQGGVLPGVTVEARSPQTVGVSTAVTDAGGVFRFPALPPGQYEVTANLQGFNPARSNVSLALGQLLRVELTLTVGGVAETIQVTAESPLIDVKQNAAFANIQKEIIDKIPKGRDFTSVVKNAPGAQDESRNGGIQIDGASGSENRFVIDGMDTTSVRYGTSGKTMLVDFIQEVQVKSSGYNAEFGGALGGVINAITKSGSNQFRGSVGTYYQNESLFRGERRASARYYPYNSNLAEKDLLYPDTPWQYLSPVGDIGGPVFRDRVWFYFGMGYTSNKYTRDAVFYSDPAKKVYTFNWNNWTVYPNYNVTTQINNNLRVKFSGSQQKYRTRKTAPGLQPDNSVMPDGRSSAGITTSTFYSNPEQFADIYDRTGSDEINNSWSGNVDWVLTPSFFINATAGYFYQNTTTPEEFRGSETRRTFSTANSNAAMAGEGFPLVPAAFQQNSGYFDNKTTSGTVRNIYDRLFFNANTIWYKSLAGQHVFKAGIRFERFGNDIESGNTKPNIAFSWGRPYTKATGEVIRGTYGYYTVSQSRYLGDVVSNNYAIWFQDSWTVNNRLTINAGIRSETEHIPSYKKTADAIEMKFGFGEKIAPRLGFAYDLKGDGRWKAYGSYGLFYDITKLELPIGQWGGQHWINYYWTLDTYDWASINCGEGTTGCPGTFLEEYDYRRSTNQQDPDLTAYFGRPMTGVDEDMKPVRTGEFTLGMDHELNSTMSIGARYVHKWLDYTIEDVGIVFPGIGEIYIHGNPGYGLTKVMIPEFSQYETPPATRKYDALELRLRKRLSNNWSGDVSYTLSRIWGNYSGLASSDEGGRTSPNVNRYFDALYMSYNKNQEQVFGRLHTDRPHVLKVSGTYDFDWGTSVGLYGIVQSGLVLSQEFLFQGYPVFSEGRGSRGRSDVYSQLDLNLQHEFRLGGNRRLVLNANISNLLDQKTFMGYYSNRPWRDSVRDSDALFFGAPWEAADLVAYKRAQGASIRDEQLFNYKNLFQGRRDMRLQVKFMF